MTWTGMRAIKYLFTPATWKATLVPSTIERINILAIWGTASMPDHIFIYLFI
jgi:hypothetical protein